MSRACEPMQVVLNVICIVSCTGSHHVEPPTRKSNPGLLVYTYLHTPKVQYMFTLQINIIYAVFGVS